MSVKFGWIKAVFIWGYNVFWIFKNAEKLKRLAQENVDGTIFCPRENEPMIFSREEPFYKHETSAVKIPDQNKRIWHYQCKYCDYTTHAIYHIKNK